MFILRSGVAKTTQMGGMAAACLLQYRRSMYDPASGLRRILNIAWRVCRKLTSKVSLVDIMEATRLSILFEGVLGSEVNTGNNNDVAIIIK